VSDTVGLPPALQHAAQTRDDGEPRLTVTELLSIAVPTAPELAYATRHGWLDFDQAVAVIRAKRERGANLHPSEERLAAGTIGLAEFAVETTREHVPDVAVASYWTFVLMSWAWRVRPHARRPSDLVEAVFTELDKPYSLEPFAWMGRRWGPKVGFLRSRQAAQQAAWRAYLDGESGYYADRAMLQSF
jgi:hypothetical protein